MKHRTRPIAGIMLVLFSFSTLTACNNNFAEPIESDLNHTSTLFSLSSKRSHSVSEYAELHNQLMDLSLTQYPEPRKAMWNLKLIQINAASFCGAEISENQIESMISDFFHRYPTPDSLLNQSPAKLLFLAEETLEEAVIKGEIGRTTSNELFVIFKLLTENKPFKKELDSLASKVDSKGSELEKIVVGTLQGSSVWWTDFSSELSPENGKAPSWFLVFLVGQAMDALGALIFSAFGVGYLGSFFASLCVAYAAVMEPADYPHWGTHYKAIP